MSLPKKKSRDTDCRERRAPPFSHSLLPPPPPPPLNRSGAGKPLLEEEGSSRCAASSPRPISLLARCKWYCSSFESMLYAVPFPRSDLLICGDRGFCWGFVVVSGNAGGSGKSRGASRSSIGPPPRSGADSTSCGFEAKICGELRFDGSPFSQNFFRFVLLWFFGNALGACAWRGKLLEARSILLETEVRDGLQEVRLLLPNQQCLSIYWETFLRGFSVCFDSTF